MTDAQASYTQLINVTPDTTYDFIIYANSYSGVSSKEDCDSCKVTSTLPCGDGFIMGGEDCDGSQFGGAVCTDFGFDYGTIGCKTDCTYDFSTCWVYSSGGGTTTEEDTIDPVPGSATSPAYAGTSPFEVTYSGASDTGGSGLSYVELFYKRGTGSWISTGLTSSGGSGSFEFTPDSDPNTTYYFDLQAWDNDGNASAEPGGNGDTSTIIDAQPPSIQSITVPSIATSLPIVISYINAVDTGISGLDYVELWYKKGDSGEWLDSGLTRSNASDSFDFNLADESAEYYFDLIAVDKAGNRSIEEEEAETPVPYDIDPPALEEVTIDTSAGPTPIIINYSGAVDIGPAGMDHVELWYMEESDGNWINTGQTRIAENGSFEFIPTILSGNFHFAIELEDTFGNRTEQATDQGNVSILYEAEAFTAELSNLPAETTDETFTNIRVRGDNIVAYKFKIDGENYSEETPVTEAIDLVNLQLGTHSLSVIGKNSFGQWQPESAPTSYSWLIVAEPEAVLSGLPAAQTQLTTTDITVGGTNVVTYKFKLDSGTYGAETPVDTKINLSSLSTGIHTISVIAKNENNLWQSQASATTHTWTIEQSAPQAQTAPTAVLTNLPATQTELTTTDITVGGENVVAYKLKLDSGNYGVEMPVANKINLSGLSTGAHTISVIAKNGNDVWQLTSNATTYTWTITAPTSQPEEGEEEVTAEEGEGDEEETTEEETTEEETTEEETTPEAQPESTEPEEESTHCENEVKDADEENIDCGGSECFACIDVLFTILAEPMGRMPGDYGAEGSLNLFSSQTGNLIKSPEIIIQDDGTKQILVTGIPAKDYQVGIKERGFLQKIIKDILLSKETPNKLLDFTLEGAFKLIGGDVFNDNIINSFDLALLLNSYLEVDDYLDINRDGRVNAADLAMILQNYQLRGDSPQ